jgi:hypothetical protein
MPPNAKDVIKTIGASRIAPYRSHFQCKTDEETLGAYFWGQAVSSAFQACLGMYEVTLRNAIDAAASKFAKNVTWYDYAQTWALPLHGTTKDRITDELYSGKPPLRRAPQPTPDAVVSSLSFGFWNGFLNGLTFREQPRILTDTFAFHPHSTPKHWTITSNVVDLMVKLQKIQRLRNAVAHLEPIWKKHRLKGTETHWSHCVVSLRELHEDMMEIISWCCPDAASAVKHSYARRLFLSICSTDAVKAFKADPFAAGRMTPFAALLPRSSYAMPPTYAWIAPQGNSYWSAMRPVLTR